MVPANGFIVVKGEWGEFVPPVFQIYYFTKEFKVEKVSKFQEIRRFFFDG